MGSHFMNKRLFSTMKRIVSTPNAPKAVGPYSQAVVHPPSKTVYVSGCIGLDAKSGEFTAKDVVGQAEQSLKNMGEVLKAAGSSFDNVLQKSTKFMLNSLKNLIQQELVMLLQLCQKELWLKSKLLLHLVLNVTIIQNPNNNKIYIKIVFS